MQLEKFNVVINNDVVCFNTASGIWVHAIVATKSDEAGALLRFNTASGIRVHAICIKTLSAGLTAGFNTASGIRVHAII